MHIFIALVIIILATILCTIEIPKLLKENLHKELIVFLVLVAVGIMLAVWRAVAGAPPNPSDWLAWIYSPLEEIMKGLMK